jgi:hypothetical protein
VYLPPAKRIHGPLWIFLGPCRRTGMGADRIERAAAYGIGDGAADLRDILRLDNAAFRNKLWLRATTDSSLGALVTGSACIHSVAFQFAHIIYIAEMLLNPHTVG